MSGFLTHDEIADLVPSEFLTHATPIPTQIVSSDEYTPPPQSEKQKEVEARLLAMGDDLGGKQGLTRRRFFQTASGMAAGFLALNDSFGTVVDVSRAKAAAPEVAAERAASLKDQFIMDMHTHSCATTRGWRIACARARRSARPGGIRRWWASRRRSRT
jgi:hypothetical protein